MVQSIFVVKLHNILVLSFHHIVFHFQIVYCVKNLVFYLVNSKIRSEFLLRQEASHYNWPKAAWPPRRSKNWIRGFPNQWQNYLGDKHIDGTNDKFSTGFDSNRQWLKINRITDTDFFPEYTLEINGKKVSAKISSTFSIVEEWIKIF